MIPNFALTMITEIGDITRFPHPRQLVSWMGMDIREYSSGGKPNRFGTTHQGHRDLRTAFIEANQRGVPHHTTQSEDESHAGAVHPGICGHCGSVFTPAD